MKALTFRIHTLQPVLVGRPGAGEENSAVSLDYIPGSAIRGLLVNRYLKQKSVSDPAKDLECRRLFFDGTVIFLNAYPTHRTGERALPKPFSWAVDKDYQDGDKVEIYDLAVKSLNDDSLVELKGAFCYMSREDEDEDEPEMEIVEPRKFVTVHNASADRNIKRRGWSTVFQYETIAAGQTFSGAILSQDERDLESIKGLLEEGEKAHIGGSRSAGYGLIRIEPESNGVINNWSEYIPDNALNGLIIVTLLSDTILRDPDTGCFAHNLDKILGAQYLKAFVRTRVVGGFNRKWGLPLSQALAVQAGSVFVYETSKIDSSKLQRIVEEGVGERRVDGFGRVAVNWHTRAIIIKREVPGLESGYRTISLSDLSQKLAQRMAERILRQKLNQKLMQALANIRIEHTDRLTTTQLSRLRAINLYAWHKKCNGLGTSQKQCYKDAIVRYLNELKRPARIQFEHARIGNKRLFDWLKEGVEKNYIWEEHLKIEEDHIPSVAGIKVDLTEALQVDYISRLLDALLKRAIKEIQETREKQDLGGGAK